MTFSIDVLEAELKRDEGVRAMPYKDTRGFDTVGIGHNLNVSPLPYKYPLTSAQIDAVFKNDIASTVAKLDKALPWWRSPALDDARQRVLINMAFNMGIGVPGGAHGLLSFKNFLAHVQAGEYSIAADMMLKSLWATQVGQRANRLSVLMRNGDTPSVAQHAPVPAPKPVHAPNPLEQIAMNISLFSLVLRLLPLLPMLEANIALEVKDLASTADGKTKVLHLIDVLQDMLQKIENALKGTNDPTA